jgi:hypothetical protein
VGDQLGRALGCASNLKSARNEQQRSTNEQRIEEQVKEKWCPPPPLSLSISRAAFKELIRILQHAHKKTLFMMFSKVFYKVFYKVFHKAFASMLQCFYKVFTRL